MMAATSTFEYLVPDFEIGRVGVERYDNIHVNDAP